MAKERLDPNPSSFVHSPRARQHRPTKQIYKEIRGLRDIFMNVA